MMGEGQMSWRVGNTGLDGRGRITPREGPRGGGCRG